MPSHTVFVYFFGGSAVRRFGGSKSAMSRFEVHRPIEEECWARIDKSDCKVWDDDSRAAYEEKTLDAKIKQTILDDLAKWEKDGTRALRIRTNG